MTVKVQKAQVIIDDEEDQNSSASESDKDEVSDIESTNNQDKESDNESENHQIDTESAELVNEGWADSIAKILKTNKPKKKKSLVLSKAKKLNEVKQKKVVKEIYEIATEDGQVKKEVIVKDDKETEEPAVKKKKRELPSLRVKPNILEKDRERIFQKIATKGVVQLFNAVKMQQNDISKKLKEAGPLEVRKEKVLKNIDKRAFLDVLMGEKSTKVDEKMKEKSKKEPEHSKKSSEWSVLRDDFMMSAKMKDWDKEMENEDEESEKEMEIESD